MELCLLPGSGVGGDVPDIHFFFFFAFYIRQGLGSSYSDLSNEGKGSCII